MNAAHYHLILNHIPIFTTLIGILILVWGMIKRSQSINNIAFVLLIIGAVASYVALESGNDAEACERRKAENIMGQVIEKAGWERSDLIFSTKIFSGGDGPNESGRQKLQKVEGLAKIADDLGIEISQHALVWCP